MHFTLNECNLIEEIFKRFMDDSFVLRPKNVNINVFRELLNELHSSSKFRKRKNSYEQNFDTFVQVLNFLDVSVIWHQNGQLETDISYIETNSHDYLYNLVTIRNTQSKTDYTIWLNKSSYLYLMRRGWMKVYLN